MNQAVRDCLVTGYEARIESLALPDSDDRHVLAAAIHCEARWIVTFNRRDFPVRALAPHGIVAIHPDDFAMLLVEKERNAVIEAFKSQRSALKNPPQSAEELLGTLEKSGLKKTVEGLKQSLDRL